MMWQTSRLSSLSGIIWCFQSTCYRNPVLCNRSCSPIWCFFPRWFSLTPKGSNPTFTHLLLSAWAPNLPAGICIEFEVFWWCPTTLQRNGKLCLYVDVQRIGDVWVVPELPRRVIESCVYICICNELEVF